MLGNNVKKPWNLGKASPRKAAASVVMDLLIRAVPEAKRVTDAYDDGDDGEEEEEPHSASNM